MLLTFIWNLLTGTLTWYYLLLSILQNEIWKICWKFLESCHSPQSSLVLSETFGTKAIVCNIERVSRRDAKHTLRISNWIECVITRTGREVWKFGNMKCREDHSQTGNLCSCENEAWKNSGMPGFENSSRQSQIYDIHIFIISVILPVRIWHGKILTSESEFGGTYWITSPSNSAFLPP